MEYFFGEEEIEKTNESNFDEIKCIARYNIITGERFSYYTFHNHVTVENNTILCQDKNFVSKFLYLPSKFSSRKDLSSVKTSWFERVHVKVVEDEYTLLYIRDKFNNKNILFDNGVEFLRLNYVINAIKRTEFYNNYLAIVTENIQTKLYKAKSQLDHGFILIKIISKNNNEDKLVELFQTNLVDMLNLYFEKMIFN